MDSLRFKKEKGACGHKDGRKEMGVSVEVESEGMDSIGIYYLYVHIQFSNNKT